MPRQWSSTCSQSRTLSPSPYSGTVLAVDQVGDEQRDDLLGVLVGPVVVGAAGDRDVEPVCDARRSGRSGRAPALAAEYGEFGSSGRSSVQRPFGIEPYTSSVETCRTRPTSCAQAGVEQRLGAEHVGHDEVGSAGDRPVDVGLGGEVDHRVVPGQGRVEHRRVADVAVDERVPRARRRPARGWPGCRRR